MGEIPTGFTEQQPNTAPPNIEPLNGAIKLGEFTIDFNQKVAIGPDHLPKNLTVNTLKLIQLLIENKETYVSSGAIHDFIYGNQYKDDSSVRKQVTTLRKVLGDTAKDKRYIENKIGHGYRLVVDAEVIKPSLLSYFRKPVVWLSLVLFVLLVIWVRTLIDSSQKPLDISAPVLASRPLTHFKGQEYYPDVSPDGQLMLIRYQPDIYSNHQLYLRDMQTGTSIALKNDEYNYGVARWNHSGKKVTFARFGETECDIIMAEFDRSSMSLINERIINKCAFHATNAMVELWPDDSGFYYNKAESLTLPFKIYSHSFNQETGWPVASPPPNGKGDYAFSLSEDGGSLAVLRNKNWTQTEVWLYNTETWETKLVDTLDGLLFMISWGPEGNSLIYKSNEYLKEYSLVTNKSRLIAKIEVPFSSPLLVSKDRTQPILAVGKFFKDDIDKLDLENNKREVLIESSFRDLKPLISADGKRIAWVSNRTGVFQIWYQEENNPPESLTDFSDDISFSSLEFDRSGTRIGGVAKGRWFIYDIEERSMSWSNGDEYYSYFHWTRADDTFYVARKSNNGWSPLLINAKTNEATPLVDAPLGTIMILQGKQRATNYYVTLNKTGFWRQLDGQEPKFFPTENAIYAPFNWGLSSTGLYYVYDRQIYYLDEQSEQPEPLIFDSFSDAIAVAEFTDDILVNTRSLSDINLEQFELKKDN